MLLGLSLIVCAEMSTQRLLQHLLVACSSKPYFC